MTHQSFLRKSLVQVTSQVRHDTLESWNTKVAG